MAIHVQALHSVLVLFGGFDILIGVLIVRSGLLPRLLGVVTVVAGAGWLTHLWPPLADKLSRIVEPAGFLDEVLLMIWLLAKGVDEERWREMAAIKR
jgi:hypothetical protein